MRQLKDLMRRNEMPELKNWKQYIIRFKQLPSSGKHSRDKSANCFSLTLGIALKENSKPKSSLHQNFYNLIKAVKKIRTIKDSQMPNWLRLYGFHQMSIRKCGELEKRYYARQFRDHFLAVNLFKINPSLFPEASKRDSSENALFESGSCLEFQMKALILYNDLMPMASITRAEYIDAFKILCDIRGMEKTLTNVKSIIRRLNRAWHMLSPLISLKTEYVDDITIQSNPAQDEFFDCLFRSASKFLSSKLISKCTRCGDFFEYQRGKKYCSALKEKKNCAKKASNRKDYERHFKKRRESSKKFMADYRLFLKERGVRK